MERRLVIGSSEDLRKGVDSARQNATALRNNCAALAAREKIIYSTYA